MTKRKKKQKQKKIKEQRKKKIHIYIYVVVNFLSQVIFIFLLFLGMEIYANEVETKEK